MKVPKKKTMSDGSYQLGRLSNRTVPAQAHQSHSSPRDHFLTDQVCRSGPGTLRIFKFGGTSVGDASCIKRVTEIVDAASRESRLAVVVSAMAGVTNRLIEAATLSEQGKIEESLAVFMELRERHFIALSELIHSQQLREHTAEKLNSVLAEGRGLCEATAKSRVLTPVVRDVISSLGERLSAPLIAAALDQRAVKSEAVNATEVFVTDSYHGSADPHMELTRLRCVSRLSHLLALGIVPVLTGFIGATQDGVLTTLGRGGSDYSATILGAALDADEVVIWTDVNGMLTADPCLITDACTIAEISYREAAELASFGAKVLHPKTMRPVMQSGIPLWIRNTFAPDQPGTKITPEGRMCNPRVKAVTAFQDTVLIRITGTTVFGSPQVWSRLSTVLDALRTNLLLASESAAKGNICVAVPAISASSMIEALQREFNSEAAGSGRSCVSVAGNAAIVTVVGQNLSRMPEIAGLALGALRREEVTVITSATALSECSISFAVPVSEMKTALEVIHWEFRLGTPQSVRGDSCSAFDLQASAAD